MQHTVDGNLNKNLFWNDTLNTPVKPEYCKSLIDLRLDISMNEIANPQFIITSPTSENAASSDLIQVYYIRAIKSANRIVFTSCFIVAFN